MPVDLKKDEELKETKKVEETKEVEEATAVVEDPEVTEKDIKKKTQNVVDPEKPVDLAGKGRKELVVLKTNLRCRIGNRWYDFKAGKKYFVSKEVKEVLRIRGILIPV